MRIRSAVRVVLLLLGAAACGDAPASVAAPVEPRAASLEKVDGDAREGLIFTTLPEPLRVRVTDAAGKPMVGFRVAWSATAGTLAASTSFTDGDGVASMSWRLSNGVNTPMPDGEQHLTAAVPGLPPVTFVVHVRWGMRLRGTTISPAEVNVAHGAATVDVRVRAATEIGQVTEGVFRLYSPSTQQFTPYTRVYLVGGDGTDGLWKGTAQIPQSAEPGQWKLELTLRSTHEQTSWPNHALSGPDIMKYLVVTHTP